MLSTELGDRDLLIYHLLPDVILTLMSFEREVKFISTAEGVSSWKRVLLLEQQQQQHRG